MDRYCAETGFNSGDFENYLAANADGETALIKHLHGWGALQGCDAAKNRNGWTLAFYRYQDRTVDLVIYARGDDTEERHLFAFTICQETVGMVTPRMMEDTKVEEIGCRLMAGSREITNLTDWGGGVKYRFLETEDVNESAAMFNIMGEEG